MKEFVYKIKDELGIHARPAGLLVKKISSYQSNTEIECKGKKADGKKIFSLMSLGVKQGDEITVKISGNDEETVCEELKHFLNENL